MEKPKEIKNLTKKEKAMFVAGLLIGGENLVELMKGSARGNAQLLLGTSRFNYFKEHKEFGVK